MKKQTRKQATAEALFYVGLVPPTDIQEEINAMKQVALERFRTGHALTSPPHVTLLPPFRSERTDFSALGDFAQESAAVDVQLRNFDKFDQRVIFVDVVPNEALTAMQKDLELYAHYHLGVEPEYRPFHPHVTVAFKDLKRPVFPEAWAYFSGQTYERSFTADKLTLFKYNGKSWDVGEEWPLGKQN